MYACPAGFTPASLLHMQGLIQSCPENAHFPFCTARQLFPAYFHPGIFTYFLRGNRCYSWNAKPKWQPQLRLTWPECNCCWSAKAETTQITRTTCSSVMVRAM